MSELSSSLQERLNIDPLFKDRKYVILNLPSLSIVLTNVVNTVDNPLDKQSLMDFGVRLVQDESDLIHLENYYGRRLNYDNERAITPEVFSLRYSGLLAYTLENNMFVLCGLSTRYTEDLLNQSYYMDRIILSEYHSKGIGTELGKFMVTKTLEGLKFAVVKSSIIPTNIASIRSQRKISQILSTAGIICNESYDKKLNRVIFSYRNNLES